MHIIERTTFKSVGMSIDMWGGISMCSEGFSSCTGLKARDNIVAGAAWSGFTGPASGCDDESNSISGNVAHSIRNSMGGYGAILHLDANDPKQSTCMKADGFFAYKCNTMGVTGGYNAGPVMSKFTNHIVLDSVVGMGLGWTGNPGFRDVEPVVEASGNTFYGESPIPDCPQNGQGGYCYKKKKAGYFAATMLTGSHPAHPSTSLNVPYHFLMAEGTAKGKFIIAKNKFMKFKSSTSDGNNQPMITQQQGPDNMNINIFMDNEFIDCDQSSFAYLPDPSPGWAGISDCGNFPCTAPFQALWHFYRNKFTNPTNKI